MRQAGGTGDFTTWACGLVLREPDVVPALVVALYMPSLSGPSKTQVSVVALNGVRWGSG
jgi:hypothetical protein